MALKLEDIMEGLIQAGVSLADRKKTMAELEKIEQENKKERAESAGPKSKKEFVVLVRGDADLQNKLHQAWIVQRTVGSDNSNIVEDVKKVGRESNTMQKRKNKIVSTFAEVFRLVNRKFWKPEDILVKTKEPCQVIVIQEENINES